MLVRRIRSMIWGRSSSFLTVTAAPLEASMDPAADEEAGAAEGSSALMFPSSSIREDLG